MRQTRPLPDTHPEFSIIEWPGFCEYRVENWHLARNGSGSIVHGATAWSWLDPCIPVFLSFVWARNRDSLAASLFIGLALALFLWSRCHQVLHESVFVFPTVGIQLETYRGHPSMEPLVVSKRFIHVSSLEDFVIHEGFRRWNVRYYLAAIKRSNKGVISIQVAFEFVLDARPQNILPYFPVLREVYLGVQQTMFPPPDLEET
ncbi:hypothetical protein BS17DRAFT_804875 [Gyrodon lividus]|nr:hypothetical protein BS17DRAFT_804875 [Gyrodon lividus]